MSAAPMAIPFRNNNTDALRGLLAITTAAGGRTKPVSPQRKPERNGTKRKEMERNGTKWYEIKQQKATLLWRPHVAKGGYGLFEGLVGEICKKKYSKI